jgi:tetratricopeptide (TPR) repeat protein
MNKNNRVAIRVIGDREGSGMSRLARLNQLSFTVVLSLALSPWVFAQPNHLPALTDWMGHQEEAAKYFDKGNYARAEERLNQAIKDIRPYFPETRRLMAKSYSDLARVLYFQKRYAQAEPLAQWALSVRESDKGSPSDSVFDCLYTLALIRSAQQHHAEAEPLLERALAIQEKELGRDHVNTALILDQLAIVYREQGKLADAERLYVRAIAILERKTPGENVELAETAEHYAVLLRRLKRYADADQWDARARTIRDTALSKAAKAKADQAAQQFKGYK